MVHGRTAYIVACGPRMKGSKPGSELAGGRPATSAAGFRGLTFSPSGVIQLSAATSPPGADLAAAMAHCSSVAGWNSGVLDMAKIIQQRLERASDTGPSGAGFGCRLARHDT